MFGRPEYEYEYEYLYSTKNYIGVGLQERTSLPADAGFSRRTSHTYTFNPNHKGNMKIISSEQTLSCNKEARQLAQEICPLAEVTTKQVFSRQRFDEVALTRQIIKTILINRGWSLNQVGRTFLRHHGTVIHATFGLSTTWVGEQVTVGHNAVLHGCRVENRCLIGMGAIILDNAIIGSGSIVAAGALVLKGSVIPVGSLVLGNPAHTIRPLSPEQSQAIKEGWQAYVGVAAEYRERDSG